MLVLIGVMAWAVMQSKRSANFGSDIVEAVEAQPSSSQA